ncbi:MAG: cysteine desulfurase family protein [Bacteroidota bacterium]|jgi:cysteine desulfurase
MSTTSSKIYLDFSATTPIDPAVAEVISSHLRGTFGNASSIHSFGRTSKVVLEESRELLARSIGADPAELFFTSGGTESDNHAIIGTAFAERKLRKRNHLIISSTEHHAVLDSADYLKELGFRVSYLPVDSDGVVRIDTLQELITDDTFLVSVMHANNETGVLQPIREIAELLEGKGVIFHTDAVQTFGKIPVQVRDLKIDLLSLSAHKIYGPKGIGAIYIRKGTSVDAVLHGGSQERKNRAGTENIPLIAGFAKAVSLSDQFREATSHQNASFKKKFIESVTGTLNGIVINGIPKDSLPHILSLSLDSQFYNIEGETLLLALDLQGIAASSGSACTSGSIQPSHVLVAMGRDDRTTKATVRFSFGRTTEEHEVDKTIEMFIEIARRFQR